MAHQTATSANHLKTTRSDYFLRYSVVTLIILFLLIPGTGHTNSSGSSMHDKISLEKVSAPSGGYGYRLRYYVPAPIDVFWRFKTDFDNDVLLTNEELIEHRLVKSFDNSVITEDRYATAPGLRFLWQTNVISDKLRLEFKLLNNKDCRHDFHHGVIKLSPAGNYTQVTQTAFFDFVGASLWVKYPWYGGMKSTLTSMVRWEQKIASEFKQSFLVAVEK